MISFIIPFTLMNGLFSPGKREAFRSRDLKAILLVAPVMGAILGYGFGRSIEAMLTSVLLSLLVITLLAVAFVVGARRWGFRRTEQLIFGRRGRWLAIAFFSAVYVGYGILLRPEFFPSGLPLLPIILICAGLTYLAANLLRSSREPEPDTASQAPEPRPAMKYLMMYMFTFVAIFLAFGGLNALAPSLLQMATVVIIFGGAGLPVVLLSIIAIRTLKSRNRGLQAAKHL